MSKDPTIETVARQLEDMRSEMRSVLAGMADVLEKLDVRLSNIEDLGQQTRSEVLALGADLKELRAHFK
jgi:hypothetical protein